MRFAAIIHVSVLLALACPGGCGFAASGGEVASDTDSERRQLVRDLVAQVPGILAGQDKQTGRFGVEPWNSRDQFAIYALAAAWAVRDSANPFYHSPEVLDAIMAGGDALVREQDDEGRWPYIKKDGSYWGDDRSCWTYSRWARTYFVVRDAMPPPRRARWEAGLVRGFDMVAQKDLHRIHNIPVYHAASLYVAGKALNRIDWQTTASLFLRKTAEAQTSDGYWVEDAGPVVNYGIVYFEALAFYYCVSGDKAVLPALERAGRFHSAFTYPNGSEVETIDQRNSYRDSMTTLSTGFYFSPEGRWFMREQLGRLRDQGIALDADVAAPLLLYGECIQPLKNAEVRSVPEVSLLGNAAAPDAMIVRRNQWVACLSAFTAPVSTKRWIQDRQNFVSLYHAAGGLIIGGGNTKLQPLWSTFTLGDTSLLAHTPGDTDPDFLPPPGLIHVPSDASLDPERMKLALEYDNLNCTVDVELLDEQRARIIFEAVGDLPTSPVAAHLTLLPKLGSPWKSGSGSSGVLTSAPLVLSPAELGGGFSHRTWEVATPAGSTLRWPVLPHNAYKKDGAASAKDGRIVVTIPFDRERRKQEVLLQILSP